MPESNSGAMNEEGAAEYRLKQDTAALNGSFLHDQIDQIDQVRINLHYLHFGCTKVQLHGSVYEHRFIPSV